MNEELFSGIKVLIALAQADGTVHDDERIAIENALDGEELPGGATVASLLAAEIDLSVELARITSHEVRTRTYGAACALVYVDGHVSEEERVMLRRVCAGLGMEGTQAGNHRRGLQQVHERHSLVDPRQDRRCIGASPPRGRRDRECGGIQRRARLGLAARRGRVLPLHEQRPPRAQHRAPLRARRGRASTFALGRVTSLYFESDEDVAPSALREAFVAAKKEGQKAAKDPASAIATRQAMLQAPKAALDAELDGGKITETVYADRLVALA